MANDLVDNLRLTTDPIGITVPQHLGFWSHVDGQNQPTCASTRLGTTWNGRVNRYAEPDASAFRLIWVE